MYNHYTIVVQGMFGVSLSLHVLLHICIYVYTSRLVDTVYHNDTELYKKNANTFVVIILVSVTALYTQS